MGQFSLRTWSTTRLNRFSLFFCCIKGFLNTAARTCFNVNLCTCNRSRWQCIPHGARLDAWGTGSRSERALHIWEARSSTLGIWANLRLSRPAWSSTNLSHRCWTIESLRLRQCWYEVTTSTTWLEHLLRTKNLVSTQYHLWSHIPTKCRILCTGSFYYVQPTFNISRFKPFLNLVNNLTPFQCEYK